MNAFDRLHTLRMENDEHAATMDAMRPRFETLRTRHEDGTAPKAVSSFQLFQTPEDLAARMVELADIQPGMTALEPSAGLGRIVAPLLDAGASVTACESSADVAGELFRLFPDVRLWQGDFLERDAELFDRVVMNPPFHMRSDLRHIEHARRFLKPGGVLVALCMAGHKREETLRDQCDHWETIENAFTGTGTRVAVHLLKMRN